MVSTMVLVVLRSKGFMEGYYFKKPFAIFFIIPDTLQK
jgi:hypothetical protein